MPRFAKTIQALLGRFDIMETKKVSELISPSRRSSLCRCRPRECQLTDRPIVQLPLRLTDRQTHRSADRPTDRPTDRITDRPNDHPTDRPTERPTEGRTGRLTDRPSARPNKRPTDRPTLAEQRTTRCECFAEGRVVKNHVPSLCGGVGQRTFL